MRVESHPEIAAFARMAEPFLLQREAFYCLPLGILNTLLNEPTSYPKAYLLSAHDGDELVGIAWMTPPHPLGLSEMPDAAVAELVEFCQRLADRVPAVVGPMDTVDAFTRRWIAATGDRVGTVIRQGIYQLERVRPAPNVPGTMRFAAPSDRDLLVEWSIAFGSDVGLPMTRADAEALTDTALVNGSRALWELDGRPVSMAGFGGKTASGIRVSYVYTPPERRRRGFASALVGALSRVLLDAGHRFCFLYTDLANPTSNAVYHRLGYEFVGESAHLTFSR